MPYPISPLPIDITPAVGSWVTVDLTSYFGSYAGKVVGVILNVLNYDPTTNRLCGVRRFGSTETPYNTVNSQNSGYRVVGVGSGDKIDIRVEHTYIDVRLVGFYSTDEAVFFSEPEPIVPTLTGWQTYSIASLMGDDSPSAVLLRVRQTGGVMRNFGARAVGSTDALQCGLFREGLVVAPVNASGQFQLFVETLGIDIDVMGYQRSGTTMLTNRSNYSTGTVDAYVDVNYDGEVSAQATGVYFHFANTTTTFNRHGAHRPDGSAENNLGKTENQIWGWQPLSAGRKAEQRINNTELDLYLVGWTETPPTPIKLTSAGRAIHGGVHNYNGGLL